MFFPGSRYQNLQPVQVTLNGQTFNAVPIPLPIQRTLLGYHPRQDMQRLDHIAGHYLGDPTAFWELCEVNQTICPDALAKHSLVGIPVS